MATSKITPLFYFWRDACVHINVYIVFQFQELDIFTYRPLIIQQDRVCKWELLLQSPLRINKTRFGCNMYIRICSKKTNMTSIGMVLNLKLIFFFIYLTKTQGKYNCVLIHLIPRKSLNVEMSFLPFSSSRDFTVVFVDVNW